MRGSGPALLVAAALGSAAACAPAQPRIPGWDTGRTAATAEGRGPAAESALTGAAGPARRAMASEAGAGGVGVAADPGRVVVVRDPESTVLAAAVVVPGSAWELPGLEGLTLLSAITVLEEIRPALDRLGARAAVDCDPAAFTFTLVAPQDAGARALELFLDGLFRPGPGPEALERARTRLGAALALDRASPAWQARLAVRRALHADTLDSGWVAPACGVPETLGLFDLEQVRVGALRFAARLAHVAVLTPGPIGPVRSGIEARIPAGPDPVLLAPRALAPGLRLVQRNTVTVWTSVAFPFGPGTDPEAVRLLGAILTDAVGPGVDRPGSYTASWEVLEHGAGGILVVTAVTTPTGAAEVVDRVERLAAEIAWVGVPGPVYERVSRRHRGRRLLERADPGARAAAMALDLALDRTPAPWPEPAVSTERLRAAARALRPPARARVGPPPERGDSMS